MKQQKLDRKQVRSGLKNSIRDGTATGAAAGITSTYLTPYALALGASAAQIGLLTALPQFFSTVLLPLAGSAIRHMESRKKICRAGYLVARLAWIPVIFAAFLNGLSAFYLILIFVSVSAAAASFSRIGWASWIGDIVPEKIRGTYFGRRNMLIGVSSFIAVLAAGWLLGLSDTLAGFVIIFTAALLLYIVGLHYLLKMPEAKVPQGFHRNHRIPLNVFEFLSSMKKTNFRHFMIYAMMFDFSVYLAAPFFTVYMISEIKVGYYWFAIISAASLLAAILPYRYWGRLADRYGDRAVMAICSALASLVPLIFVFSRNIPMLVLANIFSSFAWAGLDQMIFNFLLDSSPPLKRPLFIANYQFFDGLAVAAGSAAGGALVYFFGSGFLWLSAIGFVFVISFALRGIFSAFLIPKIREERIKSRKILPAKDVFKRAVLLYPVRGISHEIDYLNHCLTCWEKKARKEMKGFTKVAGMA